MKTILVLRHAKSSWSNPSLADHDRPLKGRGLKDAPKIGRLLVEQDLIPGIILSSTAKRAISTARLVADFAHYDGPINTFRDLYHAGADAYYEILSQLPDQVASAMVVGHNPGLEEFVETLGGDYIRMPTAALVHLLLQVSNWSDLDWDVEGRVLNVWLPREL